MSNSRPPSAVHRRRPRGAASTRGPSRGASGNGARAGAPGVRSSNGLGLWRLLGLAVVTLGAVWLLRRRGTAATEVTPDTTPDESNASPVRPPSMKRYYFLDTSPER